MQCVDVCLFVDRMCDVCCKFMRHVDIYFGVVRMCRCVDSLCIVLTYVHVLTGCVMC